MNALPLSIRVMTSGDLPRVTALAVAEGWRTSERVLGALRAHEPGGCLVAESGGTVVACVTTTAYAQHGWVGNLLVEPGLRRRGIGTLLMRRALRRLASRGLTTVRLEADPPGVALYRGLGFVEEFEVPRFALARARETPVPRRARPIPHELPEDVRALDREVFGDERGPLLDRWRGVARAGWLVETDGRASGYLLGLPARGGTHLGPWIARSVEDARELLYAALHADPGGLRVTAAPEANREGTALLLEAGFERTPSSLRMRRGPPRAAGRPERVFGIGNGATG